MRHQHYILEGQKTVPVDVITWATWFESHREERILKRTHLPNGLLVSTVFLGLDHNWSSDPNDPAHIFETMVFLNDSLSEIDTERYATYEEALQGHDILLNKHSNQLKEGTC